MFKITTAVHLYFFSISVMKKEPACCKRLFYMDGFHRTSAISRWTNMVCISNIPGQKSDNSNFSYF